MVFAVSFHLRRIQSVKRPPVRVIRVYTPAKARLVTRTGYGNAVESAANGMVMILILGDGKMAAEEVSNGKLGRIFLFNDTLFNGLAERGGSPLRGETPLDAHS